VRATRKAAAAFANREAAALYDERAPMRQQVHDLG
jgi:hypothetical protein